MTASSNEHDLSHDMALQKYMLLREQHETLCTHLERIRPSPSTGSGFTSSLSSPSSSPNRSTRTASASPPSSRRHSRSSERQHGGNRASKARARCSGWDDGHNRGGPADATMTTLDTITDEDTLYEISAEEQRLVDVNVGIKRALMELLGCSGVRRDPGMRMWVQSRLMETEQELRMGRRRRSS